MRVGHAKSGLPDPDTTSGLRRNWRTQQRRGTGPAAAAEPRLTARTGGHGGLGGGGRGLKGRQVGGAQSGDDGLAVPAGRGRLVFCLFSLFVLPPRCRCRPALRPPPRPDAGDGIDLGAGLALQAGEVRGHLLGVPPTAQAVLRCVQMGRAGRQALWDVLQPSRRSLEACPSPTRRPRAHLSRQRAHGLLSVGGHHRGRGAAVRLRLAAWVAGREGQGATRSGQLKPALPAGSASAQGRPAQAQPWPRGPALTQAMSKPKPWHSASYTAGVHDVPLRAAGRRRAAGDGRQEGPPKGGPHGEPGR